MPKGVYIRKPRPPAVRSFAQCSVAGCERDATRRGAGLCEMHYGRRRRTGQTELVVTRAGRYLTERGYYTVHAPGHPLATPGSCGDVYEHRKVYYDAHGAGPFPCHWCGKVLTWAMLHIDHLNDVPTDNRLENIVPACPGCNQARGVPKMRETYRQRFGVEFRGERRTLNEWADIVGITRNALATRLSTGWSIERALTEPRGKTGPRGSR